MGDCPLACPSTESIRLINKSGLPLSADSVDKLWSRVRRRHPDGRSVENRIRGSHSLTPPTLPKPPVLTGPMILSQKISLIQQYLLQLEYNHTGMQYFEVIKNRPISRLVDTARDIIRESLPIKCLEAVILSIFLLASIDNLKMFVIGFKSEFKDKTHRHVVLGIFSEGRFGTVGLSRRPELMYKPMKYETLTDLLMEFIESYKECGHKVVKIDLSNGITHDLCSCEVIQWKFLTIIMREATLEELKKQLAKYTHILRNS
ncbi:Vasohibin-2 [Oopsacas minuta]|uniref:Vasohibin-2 n=1 Tax=Oopsacas minuta TaxID=111878 RepID=A0AAV7JC23_9METZ|nr:Vasohibin-2 [Oopsacas minuta]